MAVEITVRGVAESRYAAERATVLVTAVVEGTDKQVVYDRAIAAQDAITAQLRELVDKGAVTTWSSDQVHVFMYRAWADGDRQGAPVQQANVGISAEFADFERLSGFIDYWAGRDGVEIGGLAWDVTDRSRRTFEADVRRAAVDNAVNKAKAYADAIRRDRVSITRIADVGLLASGPPDSPMSVRTTAFPVDSAGGLKVTPQQITIRVEVDAQFDAD